MCLAAYIPAKHGDKFTYDLARNAFAHNSDGFGIMTVQDGRIVQAKTMGGLAAIWNLFKSFDGHDRIVHFRFATSGTKNLANCHPFSVLKKDEGAPFDLAMVHNGVISNFTEVKSQHSDTANFVSQFLTPLLSFAPDAIFDDLGKKAVANIIDGGRLIFLAGDGRVSIINEDSGSWKDGIWYSNEYSLRGWGRGYSYYGWDGVSGYRDEDERYTAWWKKNEEALATNGIKSVKVDDTGTRLITYENGASVKISNGKTEYTRSSTAVNNGTSCDLPEHLNLELLSWKGGKWVDKEGVPVTDNYGKPITDAAVAEQVRRLDARVWDRDPNNPKHAADFTEGATPLTEEEEGELRAMAAASADEEEDDAYVAGTLAGDVRYLSEMDDDSLRSWIFDEPDQAEELLAEAWANSGVMSDHVARLVATTVFSRLGQKELAEIIRDATE